MGMIRAARVAVIIGHAATFHALGGRVGDGEREITLAASHNGLTEKTV
jgi:hypothetical protein